MTTPEFSCPIDVRQSDRREINVSANEQERAALAKRFHLVKIEKLDAKTLLNRDDRDVAVTGRVEAKFVQRCAVSAEDLPVTVSEEISLRFVPRRANYKPDEELEIDADDCDEIEYDGTTIDVGEAVAQSLALAIDPFATGPQASKARSLFKSKEASPFAALAALKIPKGEKDEN